MNLERAVEYHKESERLRLLYGNLDSGPDNGHFVVPVFERADSKGLVEGVYFTSDRGLCYARRSQDDQESVELWPFELEVLEENNWDMEGGPLYELEPEDLAIAANEQIGRHFNGVIASLENVVEKESGDNVQGETPKNDSST